MFAAGAGQLVGRRIDEFASRARREQIACGWASFLAAGHDRGEYEMERDDATRVAFEYTAIARIAPCRHLAIFRDVTERRKREELLERQRRTLVDAQSAGGFGTWTRNLVTGTLEWSDELHRIFGVPPGTMSSVEQFSALLHPDDRGRVQAVAAVARSNQQAFRYEYRIVRPDGAMRWVESRGEVTATRDGQALRMLGTTQDITDRKQAEAEQQNLSTILDASDDAITTCSLDGIFVSWNRGAEKLYGYTAAEAIGEPLSLVIPPAADKPAREAWQRIVRGERAVLKGVRINRDGREIVVATTLSPIVDAAGEITGVAAIGRDITDYKRAQAELAQAHAQAVEASRLKSQFIANMNHELRTPLNGVLGIASLLLETVLTEEQHEYVDALQVSGAALIAVIEDILDFSKIEAGKLELRCEPFELRALVEDVCAMVALGAPNRIEVASHVDHGLPVTVCGDSNRVRQVLTNLAINAVKFTDAGEVAIHVNELDGGPDEVHVRFEVADTGIGIRPSALASIFESFAQADGSTTRRYGGTGLGLAIAKQLVTLMGGEIGVRSTPGEGSTFWFTLPLRAVNTQMRPAPDPALQGVHVLIVDDSATIRAVLARQLAQCGMTVETASDGQDALALMRAAAYAEHGFDVALLDLTTSNMNGAELVQAVRADPALQAIALVMMASPHDARAGTAVAELNGFLTKPIRRSRLCAEIERLIGARTECATASRPAEPRNPNLRRRGMHRVLVAEDNPVNQLVAVRLLERRGCEVDVAANGNQALQMYEQTRYDAIFMDCQMPELDGYETTRAIRRREHGERHTPIIAITASTMPGDTERCLTAGMDYYTGKPISQTNLDYILNQLFGPSDLDCG